MAKRMTKAQIAAEEMVRREDLSSDLLMGYCEEHDLWYQWDKVWEEGKCPKCGRRPSSRFSYQVTTARTFNPYMNRPKIKR